MLRVANSILRNKVALITEITEVYQPVINRNGQKIKEFLREKADVARKSELARKLRVAKGYYTLEMAPPSINEIERIKTDLKLVKEFIKTGCFRYLTVKQALLLVLVCIEVGLWFFLGETIGKMHFVGYKV